MNITLKKLRHIIRESLETWGDQFGNPPCMECGKPAEGIMNDDYYCQHCIDTLFTQDENGWWNR
jgi:hypothetical protein